MLYLISIFWYSKEIEHKSKESTNSKLGRQKSLEPEDIKKNFKSVLNVHHGDMSTPISSVNNNLTSENYSRALNSSQKISSILPPPPLLIRPTPITQSRESILLNTEAKFWGQGNLVIQIINRVRFLFISYP